MLFVVSRLAYFAAGIRFDLSPLLARRYTEMQLLSTGLLQHHLIASVWDLNSQPPLFNLYSGILLKLPDGLREPVAVVTFLALGLVIVLCAFAAMVELHVPTWLALVVTALIIADPAFVLYENWLSYGYPTAALLTFAVLSVARYVRTCNRLWGLGFFAAVAFVVLLDSSFQYLWLVAVLVAVLVGLWGRRRTVLLVALVPVLLVVGWAAKDAVQFGTFTTSSWLGMNLAKTTIAAAGPRRVDALVQSHVLTPFAEVPTFAPVSAYVPRWVRSSHTGNGALDQVVRSDGSPNYNNLAYVEASKKFLARTWPSSGRIPASTRTRWPNRRRWPRSPRTSTTLWPATVVMSSAGPDSTTRSSWCSPATTPIRPAPPSTSTRAPHLPRCPTPPCCCSD